MEYCRWAPVLSDPMDATKAELLVSLAEHEQVARGQELLGMLQKASESSEFERQRLHRAIRPAEDWNVVVKQTFIEVVIPPCERTMKRSMSDSALPRFQSEGEKPWERLVSDKLQDLSDASTNVSFEAEDCDTSIERSPSREDMWIACADEGESDEACASSLQYPYVESWWMPMNMEACATPYCPALPETQFFDGSFMPVQWTDQSMSMVESHGLESEATGQEWRTTVMIRNMPNNYTREMLLELVDSMGFVGTYDFAYLPIDFNSQAGLGYAFINFESVARAQSCFDKMEGFSDWKVPSEKVCTVTWSSPTQGFEAHIERYQNSPVMHHSLPDEWKPVLLQQGVRIPFPPPTKPIKTPKVRQHPSVKGTEA